jgi:hypothetical protein
MAKNRVQFQAGLSLPAFLRLFGTEEQCRQAVHRWRWPSGFRCPGCGHAGHCALRGRDVLQCHRCRRQTSIISGTLFASSKLPLRTWFLAMFLLTRKAGVSALALRRELGVSYNTAWLLKHKLMQAMKERDDRLPLGGWVQVDDAVWGGEHRGGKCGRNAPGKTPFLAAIACNAQGRPRHMRLTRITDVRHLTIMAWAERHLVPGSAVVSDGLIGLRGLAAVSRHEVVVTGGGIGSATHPRLHWVNTMLGNVKTALRGTYHGLRAKHLPRYLAEFSYRFNRRFDLTELMPRLGRAAATTPPLPYRLATLAEAYG